MSTPQNRSFLIAAILIGGLVVIAAAAYFWPRTPSSDQSSTLSVASPSAANDATPPPASSSAAVKTDADNAGKRGPEGSDARTRQLHETVDGRTAIICRMALLRKKSGEAFNCDNVKEDDVIGQRICNNARAGMHSYAEGAAAEAAPCPETMTVAAEYYKAIRNAALAGDDNARRCFIQGYFDAGDDRIGEEERTEYVPLAKKFIESSLESGDWGVVRWLARVSIYVEDGLLRRAYPIGIEHPDTLYKMNYLMVLSGRTEYGADDAKRIIGALRSNGTLSPEQIRSAEEWAKDTYRNYFIATPNTGPTGADSFCTAQ
jgi:hypothetical protein